MWTSPPTAQGERGLDRPLLNLSQRRPGTKLSVAAAPGDGMVTTSSSTPPEPREDWEHGVDLYVARQPILDRDPARHSPPRGPGPEQVGLSGGDRRAGQRPAERAGHLF